MGWLSDHINMMALIAAIVILVLTVVVVGNLIKKMRDSKADGEFTSHKWDGIAEFANDIPVGWIISFIVLIIWGFWYVFFGYPLNSYSQIGEYNQELGEYNVKFEEKWKNLSDEDKIKMGQGIFLVKCSQCHGVNAEGINGKAQNLTHWGKVAGIMDVIKHGSAGLGYMAGEMPALEVSSEDSELIAKYILSQISNAHIKFADMDAKNLKKAKTLLEKYKNKNFIYNYEEKNDDSDEYNENSIKNFDVYDLEDMIDEEKEEIEKIKKLKYYNFQLLVDFGLVIWIGWECLMYFILNEASASINRVLLSIGIFIIFNLICRQSIKTRNKYKNSRTQF